MAEETFQRVIPRGTRLRQLLDVEIPGTPLDGSLLLWDAAQGRWVARQLTIPAHTHAPAEISPQGAGSGLDADLLDGQHASAFASAFHSHPDATTSAAGFMSAGDKSKLDGIQAGAEVNQNAFSQVQVGSTVVAATTKTDTITLVAGSNLALIPDVTNKRVTLGVSPQGTGSGLDADSVDGQHASAFASASHTHPNATTTAAGFLSASDKVKLDGIQAGAEVNQNAFSNVKVGSTIIAATTKTDTVELVAGSNVTLTPDATNKRVTIAASGGSSINSFGVVQVGSTNVAATVPGDTVKLAAGSNVTLTPDATTKQVTVAVSPQGSGSGLHADLLDSYHAGNSSNQIPVSNGTVCANLNADLLDGYHASSLQNQNAFSNVAVGSTTIAASATTDTLTLASGSNISLSANTSTKTVTVAVSPQGSGSNLHADLLDSYHAGNSSNQVPVSNGTVCTNLNADLVDGYHASNFLLTSGGSISGNLSVSGYVTMGNLPFLFRGKTTSQSIAASTTTVVSFPTAVSLTGPGSWNSTSNGYTVGLAGLYLVVVAVLLNGVSGGGRVSLRVRRNGVEHFIYDQNINTADYVQAAGQILLRCAVNDTIDVVIWCGTSRSTVSETTAGTFNRLQIVFLG
jgi:outer membrane protein assembly factor BamE (lipoprotein component of BamABCDE complex)